MNEEDYKEKLAKLGSILLEHLDRLCNMSDVLTDAEAASVPEIGKGDFGNL